jgi:hypothetical protein
LEGEAASEAVDQQHGPMAGQPAMDRPRSGRSRRGGRRRRRGGGGGGNRDGLPASGLPGGANGAADDGGGQADSGSHGWGHSEGAQHEPQGGGGAPRNDSPQYDSPRHDAPRNDAPRNDAPRNDAPRNDAPASAPPAHSQGGHEGATQAPTPAPEARPSVMWSSAPTSFPPPGGTNRED